MSEPLDPPPFWLNPALEYTSREEPAKMGRAEFVITCVNSLRSLGCNILQAIWVTSNSVGECGWGQHYLGWNLSGVKIKKTDEDTENQRWSRALGHQAGGDARTCFYRVFTSLEAHYAFWLLRYTAVSGRYGKTGERFRQTDPKWFDELIEAGYKGEVTRAHPDGSIKAHHQICDTVTKMWVQSVLGLVVDGQWGEKSIAACKEAEIGYGLPITGHISRKLLSCLSGGEELPAEPAAKENAPQKPVTTPVTEPPPASDVKTETKPDQKAESKPEPKTEPKKSEAKDKKP